ncbi:MAG: hypothetical protein V2J25_12560 [Desulfatiglans sp.]|jgi:hypothetical protein|nr:hypothetical protein [Desulfatiglans sp.]
MTRILHRALVARYKDRAIPITTAEDFLATIQEDLKNETPLDLVFE